MLVAHGARLVMACGVCVLVGELFIPLAWCGEGDIGFACPGRVALVRVPPASVPVWVT